MLTDKRIQIIFGHYGCGKTNLSVNLAVKAARSGKKVTLVDMDVVNPYFRSSDYKDILSAEKIKVISPVSAGSTLDTPNVSPEIFYAIEDTERLVIIDVGGDDVGATAMGQFSKKLLPRDDVSVNYVINEYRNMTDTPLKASNIMFEIENASHLKVQYLINNSNLSDLTSAADIISSYNYAQEVSKITELPVIMTTSPDYLLKDLIGTTDNLFGVKIYVKPNWKE